MDAQPDSSTGRQSPAERETEEVAGLILSHAEFHGWTTDDAGVSRQLWRLDKTLGSYPEKAVVTRDVLVGLLAPMRLK